IGESSLGYISVAENFKNVPFEIKRVFWAYYTPDNIIRGRHAHHETEMILISISGKIIITTEMPGENPEIFVLENPNQGIYLPKLCWHTMQYSHNSVQLVLASSLYLEEDYIRDYSEFKVLKND
ncbi:MAG: FdtA/QdtA family cupin domain-containing protein, partial [Solirubrobacteraceae bacterium]